MQYCAKFRYFGIEHRQLVTENYFQTNTNAENIEEKNWIEMELE